MKIKDLHKDIERYLAHDCYCPNEIYSFDGFFYMIFEAEDECVLLGERKEFVICLEKRKDKNNQVLVFFKSDDGQKIYDSVRFDATENNLNIVKEHLLVDDPIGKYHFDEFEKDSTKNSLEKILALADAIMIN